jgi:predicted ATPase with chaperone activity
MTTITSPSELYLTNEIGPKMGPEVWDRFVDTLVQRVDEDAAVRLSARVLPQGRYTPRSTTNAATKRAAKKVLAEAVEVESLEGEEQYLRPNGDTYYARKWGEHSDVLALRKAREATAAAFTKGTGSPLFTLLYGEPGCGKTALVEAAFEDVFTLMGTGDTEVADLVGGYVQTPSGGFEWVDGDLIKAAENGGVYFIDEIGLIDPKVLSVVYGLMDGRREITVTANPERGTVKAHPEFYVVAATNPNAPGVRLSEALLSRFTVQTEMGTDWTLAMRLGVPSTLVTAARNLAKKRASNETSWAPQMRELLAFRDIATTFGTAFAISNLLAASPEIDRPVVADVLTRAYGEECRPARI